MRITACRRAARWGMRVGLLTAALVLLLGPAAPASAHAVLVSSSPAANAVLPTAPTEVVLTFSESVREVPGRIRVIGPDGERVDRGEPAFDGRIVTIPVEATAHGTYLVSFRVVSADSHPVTGGFTYSVGAPSTPPTDPGEAADGDPVVATAMKVVKYLGYAGLVLLVGPALVLSVLWPRRLPRRGPARLVHVGTGLVAVATLGGLWLQAPYTTGGGPFTVTGDALTAVLGSGYGAAHLVRLGILVATVLLLRPLLAGRSGPSDLVLLTVLGGAGLLTWPLAGHPAASPVAAVSVVVDAAHLAGMAVWLGGLVMLFVFLLPRAEERELEAILPVWSRWATLAVGTLLFAGTTQALIEVGSVEALTGTPYGRLIIAKVLLFALVMTAAAYARRLVLRRVGPAAPGRLRRVVGLELAVGAAVLALSATLVQTTPARTALDSAPADLGYYSTTLTSSIYTLRVEIDPATTGSNSVHVYAYTPDNRPLAVLEWKATIALPERGVEPVEIPLVRFTDNHVASEVGLPTPGNWQLRITARTSDIDQATVTATVPIK